MLNSYYEILGIDTNASFEEIKRAYKKKAKELHPDYNSSPTAHEEFISLNNAYLHLTNSQYTSQKQKQEERYAQAQEQARAYAQKRYQEFANSKYYKEMLQINEYGDIAFCVLIILIINAIAICITDSLSEETLLHSPNAWIIPALLSAIFSYIAFPITKFKNISQYENDIPPIEWGILGASLSINLIAYLSIGTKTLIPLWIPFASLLIAGLITFCIIFAIHRRNKSLRFLLHPALIGLLPMAFAFIANNQTDTTYALRFFSKESFELHFAPNPITKLLVERDAEWEQIIPYNGQTILFKEGTLGYPLYDELKIK